MKKILIGIAATAVLASPLAVSDGAHAAKKRNPGCISKPEFRKIKKGQTPRKVARIVGSKGKVSTISNDPAYRSELREYKACRPFNQNSTVFVMFETAGGPLKAFTKSADWARN